MRAALESWRSADTVVSAGRRSAAGGRKRASQTSGAVGVDGGPHQTSVRTAYGGSSKMEWPLLGVRGERHGEEIGAEGRSRGEKERRSKSRASHEGCTDTSGVDVSSNGSKTAASGSRSDRGWCRKRLAVPVRAERPGRDGDDSGSGDRRYWQGRASGDESEVGLGDTGGGVGGDGGPVGRYLEQIGELAVRCRSPRQSSVQEIQGTVVVGRETRERGGSSPKAEGVNQDKVEGEAEGGDGRHTEDGDQVVGQLVLGRSEAGDVDGVRRSRYRPEARPPARKGAAARGAGQKGSSKGVSSRRRRRGRY